ncbi:MAG: tetratricopeptide repeat protein [Deltaproteobacteria bacterium]|nr:tetratricopeptide repeat protein [Deltaproteobacteria bacterium]
MKIIIAILFFCTVAAPSGILAEEAPSPYSSAFSISSIQSSRFDKALQRVAATIAAGEAERAIKELERVSTRFRQEILLMGIALQQTGDEKQAEKKLREYLKEHPSSADAKFFLALLAAKRGDLNGAEQLLDEAAWFGRPIAASLLAIKLELANVQMLQGKREKASETLKKLATENPDTLEIPLFLAKIRVDEGKKDEALLEVKKVLDKQPGNPAAVLIFAKAKLLGLNKNNIKQASTEALEACDRLLASGTASSEQIKDASIVKLRALLASGELEKAEPWALKIGRQYPSDIEIARLKQQLALEQSIQVEEAEGEQG